MDARKTLMLAAALSLVVTVVQAAEPAGDCAERSFPRRQDYESVLCDHQAGWHEREHLVGLRAAIIDWWPITKASERMENPMVRRPIEATAASISGRSASRMIPAEVSSGR